MRFHARKEPSEYTLGRTRGRRGVSLDTSVMARGPRGAALATAAVVVALSGTEVLTEVGVERCEMRRNIRVISDLLLLVEEERVEVVRARSTWLQVIAEQNILAMVRVYPER